MSLRVISKELQKIAEEELNEKSERLQEDLKHLRDWLSKQPHINARTDDQWLITFLRGCKYSLERTKEKIDMYYTVRSLAPEYFENRDPFIPGIQELLKLGVCLPLPNVEKGGPRVFLLRNGIYDPHKISLQDVFKLYLMVHDIVLIEDDNIGIAGEVVVVDIKNVGVKHTTVMSPSLMKKAMTCFQEAYPLRVKGVHLFNISSIFETFYGLVKPFLTEKLKGRVNLYSSNNIEEVYKNIPKSILPEEYGGSGGKIADIAAMWKKKVESYKQFFEEDAKYRTDEAKRPGKPKTTDSIFGIDGSFRKLDVD